MKQPGGSARRTSSKAVTKAPRSAGRVARPRPSDVSHPVVGIGASAGGLEALDLFFRNVPAASGLAFVVVQHLDPTHKALMAELLQRATSMKVVQVADRTRVRPDCVYVIPPNKDMSILHGVLHLLDPVEARGLRLPIDHFLRSLADDAEERSIGVILSGMGTDGTLGLKAIKGKAGAVFVQDPASAKFDGMPGSAVEAGLADVIAPVEELPARILAYLRHTPLSTARGLADLDKGHSAFEKVVLLLRAQTGNDFSLYKKNTVYRRIERRMGIHQLDRITAYVRLLRENPQELELLFKELLIGVTRFFRDPDAWETLRTRVIPDLLTNRTPSEPLRIWVPACATGEEAYSFAILLREAQDRTKSARRHAIQIFATDLDRDAIEAARVGTFPANIAADVPPDLLGRYFVQHDHGFQVARSVRETVIFAPQNVIMDPPFTKLDLVSCRNLLIYLTPALQRKLLPLFHYTLNPGGCLFLGSAETIGASTDLFAPVDSKSRLYRRLDTGLRTDPVDFPSRFARAAVTPAPAQPGHPPVALQAVAEQLLLQRYAPAAVLVNDKGDILFVSGRTGRYLEPAAGKANWNVFAMAREGLRADLADAFRAALKQAAAVTRDNLTIRTDAGLRTVDLTVHALTEPPPLRGLVLVVFAEAATPAPAAPSRGRARKGAPSAARDREIEALRAELRVVREERQSADEEARSANEELQSANEELQSTNEELTTSKEEMQSMNEELQTLNHELQAKVDQLSGLNNDMRNLLESTEITAVFLDRALNVRLFTAGTHRILKLIQSDVGRPITDITSDLDYPDLADDAREVLRSLVAHERQTPARGGRWFQVRIMPYRTLDNVIDGVVITYADITDAKRLEQQLRRAPAETAPAPDNAKRART